ncbi:MAG: CHAT domain-containing tetratricopeptide repeat protein [Bacteroidia bacterium]|nr:CHAT domain-containing tetratricopeptide repeat protein [Bacteroidia bacterium]
MQIFFSGKGLLFFLLILFLLTGQTPDKGVDTASDLIRASQKAWAGGYYNSALSLSLQAKKQAKIEKDTLSLIMALRQEGKYYARNGKPAEAEIVLDSVINAGAWIGPLHHEVFLARAEKADVKAEQGDMTLCIKLYQEILRDCRVLPPDDTLRPILFQWAGQTYANVEKYDSAIYYCQQASELFTRLYPSSIKPEFAYTENALGYIYADLENHREAIRHFEKALQILSQILRPGHSHILQIRSNIATQYKALGMPRKALERYEMNFPYLDSILPAKKLSTLLNYAAALNMIGDYQTALNYLDQVENLLTKSPNLRPSEWGTLHYTRSAAYQSLGRYEEALEYAQKTIDANTVFYGPGNSELVMDYMRKGTIYFQMKKYPESLAALKKALTIAEKKLEPYSMRRAWVWEALGETQREMGQNHPAIQSFRTAAKIYIAGQSEWNLTDTYRNLALTWQNLGNNDSAYFYFQQAWKIALPEFAFQPAPNSLVYGVWTNAQVPALLEAMGNFSELQYRQTGEIDHLQEAFASYQAYIAVTDSQRYYYETSESQQYKADQQRPVVEKSLEICQKLYSLTQSDPYIQAAFRIAEQSKSRHIRDHLRDQKSFLFAGVPDSLIRQERAFRQDLATTDLSQNKNREEDSLQRVHIREEYFRIQNSYRLFLKKLETEYPAYYRLKHPTPLIPEDVLTRLKPRQALYSYFWGEKQICVFRIFQGKWEMYLIPADSLFTEKLEQWLEFITHPPGASPQHEGSSLTDLLMPGLAREMEEIILLPDGKLGYLPFGSLPASPVEGQEYRNWPFIAREHTLTYNYAAEIWLQQTSFSPAKPAQYLGFAPEFGENSETNLRASLGSLKYNREEVEQVTQMLKGKALIGAAANESAVKKRDDTPVILHFATHALADETNPMFSRLYLGQNPDTTEDDILHAWEIYGLNFNSPLIVLSACQTGNGPLLRGEGIMSLARAFQYSGSKNVLTTLWQTDDRSGATLTTSFFKFMAEGLSLENALKEAEKQWLSESDNYHCHPYFWAGYVLIGEGGEIDLQKNKIVQRIFSLIAAAVVLGGILFFFGKMRSFDRKT